jgi:hypothetical protein
MKYNKKKIENVVKNATSYSKQKYDEAKIFTKEEVIPNMHSAMEYTKNKVSDTASKVSDKVKTSVTEEQMQDILNTLYIKSVNGIPKVSLPIEDLVDDYISKNKNVEDAAKSLIKNSTIKCGTSGFITAFGGFATMIASLPANITSVMYVQLRMCCAIAKMGGYDIHSDQVQTLIYVCLTGSAASDILKQTGVKFVNKFGDSLVGKIPGKTLQAINQKVGFRFITKFGTTGVINLDRTIPVLGGVIGGGIDVMSTRIIGSNAYNMFINGKLPSNDEDNQIVIEGEYEEIDDIDTITLKKALEDDSIDDIN